MSKSNIAQKKIPVIVDRTRTFLEEEGIDTLRGVEKSDADVSLVHLLVAAMAPGDGEPVYWGLHAVREDIEVLWELCDESKETMGDLRAPLHKLSERIRVLAELHRRQLMTATRELAAAEYRERAAECRAAKDGAA
jgi:hypothetical protein